MLWVHPNPAFGQADSDSLWSFQTIRADADGDHVLDYKGEHVTISGIVNIDSGLLHEHYLQIYIQNDSTGMSVFSMQIDTPVETGDSIVVHGSITRYLGMAEVHADSYRVYRNVRPPAAKHIEDVILNPGDFIGILAEGEGRITEVGSTYNGRYFRISPKHNDGSMKVFVTNFHSMSSGFNFDVLSVGDRVAVKGIVSEYSPEFPDTRTFQLYLRTPDDLQYIGIPRYYILLSLGAISGAAILIVLLYLIHKKRVQSKTRQIELSLKQKDLLLKEIHHRVKNNLSIVYGLLEIQAAGTDNEETIGILQDSQSRIQSIALIHEKLYKTESLSGIELGVYLKDLVESIHSTFTEYKDAVTLEFDLDHVVLDTDRAVYCGLLINELVVNAYKYAFQAHKQGVLSVTLKKDDSRVLLRVCDNGPGLPRNFNPDNGESLGALLINSFADHLNAEMTIAEPDGNGTEFRFRFPYRK